MRLGTAPTPCSLSGTFSFPPALGVAVAGGQAQGLTYPFCPSLPAELFFLHGASSSILLKLLCGASTAFLLKFPQSIYFVPRQAASVWVLGPPGCGPHSTYQKPL